MSDLEEKITRARELLNTIRFATMATVNKDGSPHNSPYLFMRDKGLTKLYWGSHPESQHSQNILRTGRIFVVIYDAFKGGGLYIKAENGHITEGKELEIALNIHNEIRIRLGKDPIPLSYYTGKSGQKMWAADIKTLWVNSAVRDKEGHLIKDVRREIGRKDLLQ